MRERGGKGERKQATHCQYQIYNFPMAASVHIHYVHQKEFRGTLIVQSTTDCYRKNEPRLGEIVRDKLTKKRKMQGLFRDRYGGLKSL
jgi:hypothetical protein